MADGTRAVTRAMEDYINRMTVYEDQLSSYGALLKEISLKLTNLEGRIDQGSRNRSGRMMDGPSSKGNCREGETDSNLGHNQMLHVIKLVMPRFDGSDPLGWIFKAEQYFNFHDASDEQRLSISSFYMDGRALAWFQWLQKNHQISSWPLFLDALRSRFGPSEYRDLQGELSKLSQVGTVDDYLAKFEELSNQVSGVFESFLQSYFESGLKSEIKKEI